MIGIVNYGLGNVHAFANIYKRLNIPAIIASSPDELHGVDRIILPGVGSFDWAMKRLNGSGMRNILEEMVLGEQIPVLGICVGMQIMAKRSEEGKLAGLGWIDAEVKKFNSSSFHQMTHLPHMGWNDVMPRNKDGLFMNLALGARFYFLHSYYFLLHDENETIAITDYNVPYTSATKSGNVFGVQFHPEKSHHWGIQLLKNFTEI
ncbi:MAG: imidazole glycerol phosphate synthase subunit HisH [Syntrophorhabdaceae bacterium]